MVTGLTFVIIVLSIALVLLYFHYHIHRRYMEDMLDDAHNAIESERGHLRVVHDCVKIEHERLKDTHNQFVNILFHEMKTPLTAIIGYVELAMLEDNADITPEILKGIMRSSWRLKIPINQSVALLRAADFAPFDVALMIGSLLESDLVWPATRQHRNGVTLRQTGDEHLVMEGDQFKLETAVLALIRNSIQSIPTKADPKYHGEVVVSVTSSDDKFTIEVADNGTGIQPEHVKSLFTDRALDYVDMSDVRRSEGSYLGLRVVNSVAAMHNATIEVISIFGIGSKFRLIFER